MCAPKFSRSLGRSSADKWVYDLFQRVPRDHPVVVKVLDPIHLIREPKINERNTLRTAETPREPPEDELGLARFDVFPGLAADVGCGRITASTFEAEHAVSFDRRHLKALALSVNHPPTSGSMTCFKASKLATPTWGVPLMRKVGVEPTLYRVWPSCQLASTAAKFVMSSAHI